MPPPSHQTVRLCAGSHRRPEDGVCVMELASMLAGERFTDHPDSVCPIIAAYLRVYNDLVDDDRRQQLYGCAARVVGSRGSADTEHRRARLCAEVLGKGLSDKPRFWRRYQEERRAVHAARQTAALSGAEGAAPALTFVERLLAVGGCGEYGEPEPADPSTVAYGSGRGTPRG